MIYLRLSTALLLAAALTSCSTGSKPLPTSINFTTDFETALKDASQSGHPMIIDFYTDWCAWCDSLDANTYTDSLVIGMSVDNIFVKINAETDTALAEKFNISSFPTIVITKSDGREIDRIWGYLPPTDFYNQIQLYFQGKETLDDYLTRLVDEPENTDYLSMVADKYTSRSDFNAAIECYKKIVGLDPKNEFGHASSAMASIYESWGLAKDYQAAVKTCQELIAKYPQCLQADNAAAMIGYYTAKSGDSAAALKIYKDYLKKRPDGSAAEWVKRRIEDIEGKR